MTSRRIYSKIKIFNFNLQKYSLPSFTYVSKPGAAIRTVSIKAFHETVSLPHPGGKNQNVHPVWLRHHCQCPECFNHKTYQRIKIPSFLRNNSKAINVEVSDQIRLLTIAWNDGHVSEFSLDWLNRNAPTSRSNLSHFNKVQNLNISDIFRDVRIPLHDPFEEAISYTDFMQEASNDGLCHLLKNILNYGFGIVHECPPDFETTKKVILKVSHVQNTIYGDFSEWTNNLAHLDSAYTSDIVHLHTDTSYFTEPMGLQIFHCLKHEGTGGHSFLVDGFQVARKLGRDHPDLYQLLSSTLIPSQYVEPGRHHFLSFGETFEHDLIASKINKIRYNPHDMAALSHIPFDNIPRFYEALVLLSDLIEENPTRLKLSPGVVLFMDNWRVLHGRTAFTGLRHLCGAYISRSDWISKARVLGLLKNQI